MKIPLLTLAVIVCSINAITAQSINVSNYPPLGVYGTINGLVGGSSPEQYKIAIVDDVFDSYWSKPYDTQPTVPVNPDGSFQAFFITGGQDACAERIYLFLVPTNASVPITLGGAGIPAGLNDISIASAVVDRTTASQFTWSGHTWTKKDTGDCIWGPGPNHFSGDNVLIDGQGKLHLTVSFTNGFWRCPEIISTQSFGYGRYSFIVDSVPTNLPDQLVFGLFTYDDGALPSHREVDVEFSNGPVVGSDNPWQYVVQPYTYFGNRHRFSLAPNVVPAVQTFLWVPGVTRFASYSSLPVYAETMNAAYTVEFKTGIEEYFWGIPFGLDPIQVTVPGTNIVHYESYNFWFPTAFFHARLSDLSQNAAPAAYESWSNIYPVLHGNEKVHLNLWLYNGQPPGDATNTYEVVISGFKFQSLDPAILQPKLDLLNVSNWHHTIMDVKLTVPAK